MQQIYNKQNMTRYLSLIIQIYTATESEQDELIGWKSQHEKRRIERVFVQIENHFSWMVKETCKR